MTTFQALLGETLTTQNGTAKTEEVLADAKAVALYFSAHWCPPCRGFTPELAKWYTDDLKAKGLEVVFVSSDKDEDAFKSYFGEMPWTALPFADRERKESLSSKYGVEGIPTLVILDAQGNIINKNARNAVSSFHALWSGGMSSRMVSAPTRPGSTPPSATSSCDAR